MKRKPPRVRNQKQILKNLGKKLEIQLTWLKLSKMNKDLVKMRMMMKGIKMKTIIQQKNLEIQVEK